MKPRGLLMAEHRLIERMISLLDKEIRRIKRSITLDEQFIDIAVDFIQTYAERTHYGKEEEILFRDCAKKAMSQEDGKTMDELIEEHKYGRKIVKELVEAKERYVKGDSLQQETIIKILEELGKIYPNHIKKEDDLFFPNSEKYFSKAELETMLKEFWEFDQKMIHEKYQFVVQKYERLL